MEALIITLNLGGPLSIRTSHLEIYIPPWKSASDSSSPLKVNHRMRTFFGDLRFVVSNIRPRCQLKGGLNLIFIGFIFLHVEDF